MSFNFLKLNEDKTEYIMFGTRHQLAKTEPLDIKVGLHSYPQWKELEI